MGTDKRTDAALRRARGPFGVYRELALAVCPLVLLVMAVLRSAVAGPFWLAPNYDPEYAYLANAVNVLEGRSPWHVDHPGVPLHLLLAGTVQIRYWTAGTRSTIRDDVFNDPEAYLRAAWCVIAVLPVFATWRIGRAAARFAQSNLAGLSTQCVVLLCSGVAGSLGRVAPEPVLVATSLLLAPLLMQLVAPGPVPRPLLPVHLGMLLGTGVATKVTFAPVAIVLFGLRNRITTALGAFAIAAITFGVFILPVLPRVSAFIKWLGRLFWGSGRYGRGDRTIVNGNAYLRGAGHLLIHEPVLPMSILAGVIAGLVVFRRRPSDELGRRLNRMFWAVVFAQLSILVGTAKMPEVRYLVGFVGLAAFTVTLMWVVSVNQGRVWVRAVLVGLLGMGLPVQGLREVHQLRLIRSRTQDRIEGWESLRQLPANAVVIGSYGTSGPPFALHFAIHWSGGKFGSEVGRAYPGYGYAVGGGFVQIGAERIRVDHLVRDSESEVFALLPYSERLPLVALEPVAAFRTQTLYRLRLPAP